MKKLLFFSFVFFTILSCKDPVKTTVPEFDKIEIDKKIFASNDSTKPYMRLNLTLTYPVAYQNDTILSHLQKIFVKAFVGEDYLSKSPKGAFEAYEADFTEDALSLAHDMNDDLGLFGECFQKIKTDVVDTTRNLITVKTEIESYMGGAHGSHTLNYYNIDRSSIIVLTEKDIFSSYSEDKVTALIVGGLKKKYGEQVKDVLFDIDAVRPNGNFRFDQLGLVYVYNEYEIAPYSSGMIIITIPYEKVDPLLKEEYRSML